MRESRKRSTELSPINLPTRHPLFLVAVPSGAKKKKRKVQDREDPCDGDLPVDQPLKSFNMVFVEMVFEETRTIIRNQGRRIRFNFFPSFEQLSQQMWDMFGMKEYDMYYGFRNVKTDAALRSRIKDDVDLVPLYHDMLDGIVLEPIIYYKPR